MNITTQKENGIYVLYLNGRLDANWCEHVQSAFDDAVRSGEHRLHFDMAAVDYLSSAGIRVLLTSYKQLKAIDGLFGVVNASEFVRKVLDLAGLEDLLIDTSTTVDLDEADSSQSHTSVSASYEIFTKADEISPISMETTGDPAMLLEGMGGESAESLRFEPSNFSIGVGALGTDSRDSASRMGELIAVAGCAAFQPTDGSNRPDYMVSERALVPEGQLMHGLTGQELPAGLLRFEASDESCSVGLTELSRTVLDLTQSPAAVIVALTETSGLVGTALRQSPCPAGSREKRFGFPAIRDWMSFSSERTHRDSIGLIAGVVANPGSSLDPFLRPLEPASGLVGHFHAAAFSYSPLRKGRIDLKESVAELFEGDKLQSILHLLCDPREINGAGESEFYRGAIWYAPIKL